MFATLQAKLIGGGIAFAIFLALFFWVKDAFDDRAELRQWQASVHQTTKTASNNPKLAVTDVPAQIEVMGRAILNFKSQIVVQNKAVESLEEKRKDALAARDREAALRKEVIHKSQSLAQQLRNEALTPVERENLEAELRRVQDMAWEAGL